MQIEEYISYSFKDQQPKSKYQYVTRYERGHYENNKARLREELWRFFYDAFFAEERPSKFKPFMDFHLFECYDKGDFLAFVKKSPQRIPAEVLDIGIRSFLEQEFVEKTSDWMEGKKKILQRVSELERLQEDGGRIRPMRDYEDVSIWETEDFFIQRWTKPKRQGEKGGIMTVEQVKDFVHGNFYGSEHPVPRVRIRTKGKQKDILEAVYEYYCEVDTDATTVHGYCYMLIDVFEEFENYITKETGDYLVENLKGNFPRYKYPGWKKKQARI